MIYHTRDRLRFPLFTTQPRLAARFGLCLLATLALGCTRSEVSLGSGQQAIASQPENPCGDGVVPRDVLAGAQEEVEALRGCSEISGDFTLLGFPDMDLSPLSELRIVRGNMFVGATNALGEGATGPLPSLRGLEALEQVNGLWLSNVMTEDLSALGNLRRVNLDPLGPHTEGGTLALSGCDLLRDLSGLESLSDFAALELNGNAALESLAGLRVPRTLRNVSFAAERDLQDISALAPLRNVEFFGLQETNIESLDGLQLEQVGTVFLYENDLLEQVDSLSSLLTLRELIVAHNDLLLELPSLDAANGVKMLIAVGNAELRSVPTFQSGSTDGIFLGAQRRLSEANDVFVNFTFGFDLFEVGDNPKLARIAGIGAFGDSRHIAIYGNDTLAEIDFGILSNLASLHLVDNASLASVQLMQPARIVDLKVQNNPLLSAAAFAEVQSLSRELSGNLD